MWKRIEAFCGDERGCVPSMEWAFVVSILTLGTIVGLWALAHE